jgi:hypothetical protein
MIGPPPANYPNGTCLEATVFRLEALLPGHPQLDVLFQIPRLGHIPCHKPVRTVIMKHFTGKLKAIGTTSDSADTSRAVSKA